MQISIPCILMRGGTSKGVFFLEEDLPKSPAVRNEVIVRAFGSPDPSGRQIDGLGGGTSTTSKMAIISKRKEEVNGINYTFGQVDLKTSLVDMRGNCGNLSSAVGPYAIDMRLVDKIEEPYTKVRIYNTNTQKYIVAHVPTRNGKTLYDGDFQIAGVPGQGSKIQLDFMEPGGAVTGWLLPTGQPVEMINTDSYGSFQVSIVDAANPVVFVRAADIGLTGKELPKDIDNNMQLLDKILQIRAAAAVRIGLAQDMQDAFVNVPSVPKVAFLSEPSDYITTSDAVVQKEEIDIMARMLSMGKMHPSFAITGSICLAVACKIDGTLAHEMVPVDRRNNYELQIGHCSGAISVGAEVIQEQGTYRALRGSVFRTARRLMSGMVDVSI
ncbi:2-methylaconitate cis-trans isomerase PrpF family protein [Effusibacillus dendaii]|uniref:3-methylitaconate isomerase n=1 Tax=Effusibacillus dendaii TaxID=2743772 RepID=A0A7I8DFU8_9BACL|nr:PrpF domain-containing protein [Effusibacillus dendaii]BCJ86761.1 hypothetical protein skT53_17460 [Effusibacillus dendaii]